MIRMFRRRRPHDPEVVAAVRRSLDRNATDAPTGEYFTERVLAALDRAGDDPYAAPPRAPRRRRALAIPLASAAAVLAVVALVVLGITQLGGGGKDDDTATGNTTPPPTASPSSVHPSQSHIRTRTETPSATATAGSGNQVVTLPQLRDVQIQDVTFYSTDEGWALASAQCLDAPGKTCTAFLRTTDGHTWVSHSGPPVNVQGSSSGCATACATGIRFANDQVGYVFGPSVLFMTTDGGKNWTRQSGGALGLETADDNVVRVTSSGSGCPGPCDIGVETAPVAGTSWTRRDVGNTQIGAVSGAQLSRTGADVYLLVTANPAGGSSDEQSALFRSGDDGATWRRAGEPCSQSGGEHDSTAIGSGLDGRVGTLCLVRGSSRYALATSDDGGASFRTHGLLPGSGVQALTAGPSGVWLAGGPHLLRTDDEGGSWTQVSQVTGEVSWLGFESATVARVVTDGGSVIWTTRDGGRTWNSTRFQ